MQAVCISKDEEYYFFGDIVEYKIIDDTFRIDKAVDVTATDRRSCVYHIDRFNEKFLPLSIKDDRFKFFLDMIEMFFANKHLFDVQ